MLEQLANEINLRVSNAGVSYQKREDGDSVIYVPSENLIEVCKFLKSEPSWDFNVLQVITGHDLPPDNIEVSYILASFTKNTEVILKVKLNREKPQVDSVTSLWSSADFQERECYDMVGVVFNNHPDHRRILCPDDWIGFPLRKDYVPEKIYNNMEVNPEIKMNFPDREFAQKQKNLEKEMKDKAE